MTITTLTTHAKERSSYPVPVSFTDENGGDAVPTTITWSLLKSDGTTIVNSREDVAISSLSTSASILLSGADLAILDNKAFEERAVVVEYAYGSTLGSSLPGKQEIRFTVDNLRKVPSAPTLALEVEESGYTEDTVATTDYTTFQLRRQDVTWSDGTVGHIDSALYDDGTLRYFTLSSLDTTNDTCTIAVKRPEGGYVTVTPDYYVDSVGGSDANDGSSDANALATIGALPGLSNGDIVVLKSGSTFAETLTPVEGLSVYRYGQGAKPIIDAGVTFTAGSWALTGGRSNAYDQAVTIELDPSTSFVNVLEDGTMLSRVADAATCESTAGSFAVSADTGSGDTSVTVYMHPSDSSDPTGNGKVCRYSRLLFSVAGTDIDSVTIDGIHGRLQTHEGGSTKLGDSPTVRHCVNQYGNSHNMLVGDGAGVYACELIDLEHDSNASLLVWNADTPSSGGVTIWDTALKMSSYHTGIVVTGINGHNNVSGSFGAITYKRCASVNCGVGFAATDCTSLTLTNPYLSGCNIGATSSGVPVTWANGSWAGGNGTSQRGIQVLSGTEDITLSGLDCTAADFDSMLFVYSTQATTVSVTDCDFTFNTETNSSRIIYLTNASASFTATGNTYPTGWNSIYFASAVLVANITSDTNAFADDTEDIRVGGVTYSSVATYQAATGLDANSTIG